MVGASETRGSFGERTLSNMADFTGKVFAINPKYQSLLGRPCVPSLADMPESPDCVVLCVARPMVEGMIEAAAAVKAGGVVVYASGFAETAKPDRIEAQQRLIELAQRTGVRVVGPNCVGLANTRSSAGLNFMPDYAGMGHRRGPIGIVSQSGALGYTVLQGMQRGVGFSHYLAAGNSCDVDVCDFISYLAEDDDTRAIICLLEGVKDGGRFLDAARKARDAGKALIVYKTGNSETSSKAAMSHTGTMVGSVVAYQTAIEETGAIAIDDLEAVLETASFFAKTKAPRTKRRRDPLDVGRCRGDLRRQGRSAWRSASRRWKSKTANCAARGGARFRFGCQSVRSHRRSAQDLGDIRILSRCVHERWRIQRAGDADDLRARLLERRPGADHRGSGCAHRSAAGRGLDERMVPGTGQRASRRRPQGLHVSFRGPLLCDAAGLVRLA